MDMSASNDLLFILILIFIFIAYKNMTNNTNKSRKSRKTFATDTLRILNNRMLYYRKVINTNGQKVPQKIKNKYENCLRIKKLLHRATQHLYDDSNITPQTLKKMVKLSDFAASPLCGSGPESRLQLRISAPSGVQVKLTDLEVIQPKEDQSDPEVKPVSLFRILGITKY